MNLFNKYAFPRPAAPSVDTQQGMTLLEYFTAQSLQGLLASESEDHGYYTTIYRDPEGRETSYKGPTNNPYELIRTAEENIALRAITIAKAIIKLLAEETNDSSEKQNNES